MDNNLYIDLIQAFSYVDYGGFNLVLQLAKPLTCMTVASNSIILTTMCEKKTRHNRYKCQKQGYSRQHLCYNLNHYKTNKYVTKKHKKAYRQGTLAKNKKIQKYKKLQQHNNGIYKYRAMSYVLKKKQKGIQTQHISKNG